MKNIYLECDCHSVEHIVRLSYFKEDPVEIYLEVHLSNYRSVIKKLWVAIKYVFGYKCAYGSFDCVVLNKEKIEKMRDELNEFLKENKKLVP